MNKKNGSEAEIIKSMEANMHFQMTFLAKHSTAMQIIPEQDVTVVKSDIHDDMFNYVLTAHFSNENALSRVKTVIDIYKKAHLPFSWWVGQNDTPKDLSDILKEQGLKFKEENVGMYIELGGYKPNVNSTLKFQRVNSLPSVQNFCQIIIDIGGNPGIFDEIYGKIPANLYEKEGDFQLYVGYSGEKPILSGMLVLHAGVAGIYYVATIPTQRKKGYGTAMMEHLLLQAKNKGYDIATLQASREGKSLYERLGFTACCSFQEYA